MLAKTVEEVAKLQDIEAALVPTVFNGGTRITGDYAYHYSTVVQSTSDSQCRG